MSDPLIQRLMLAFSVLADESRLRIVALLAHRAHSVGELAALLDLKEPTVSHHLNRMKAISLLDMQREGTTHLYSLRPEALRDIQKSVFGLGVAGEESAAVNPGGFEDKVIASFFDGDRLRTIPAARKKRLVVLRHLIRRFEPGWDFPESEVNARLKLAHDDVATLRREFIIYKMMERRAGLYRRLPEAMWLEEAAERPKSE